MDPATRLDGISAIAVLLIAAFAIDRIVTAILFLLGFIPAWNRTFLDDKRAKLIYFAFAAIFSAGVVVALSGMRTVDATGQAGSGILYALGFKQHWIDVVLTMLIIMGGAERISEVLKNIDASKAVSEKPAPIEITGKLTLDEGSTIGRPAGQGR
jgi:uncharacterized membrane protein YqaE (UPF0057 family)